jgi:hypothetical protein
MEATISCDAEGNAEYRWLQAVTLATNNDRPVDDFETDYALRSSLMPRKASISPQWNVPDLFRQRLGDVAGRQRAMASEGHLLLILHELPTEQSAQRNLRLFWRAPDGTWQSDCLGGGIVALQTHLTEYSTAVDQLDRLEDEATGSEDFFEYVTRFRRSAARATICTRRYRMAVKRCRKIASSSPVAIRLTASNALPIWCTRMPSTVCNTRSPNKASTKRLPRTG